MFAFEVAVMVTATATGGAAGALYVIEEAVGVPVAAFEAPVMAPQVEPVVGVPPMVQARDQVTP